MYISVKEEFLEKIIEENKRENIFIQRHLWQFEKSSLKGLIFKSFKYNNFFSHKVTYSITAKLFPKSF